MAALFISSFKRLSLSLAAFSYYLYTYIPWEFIRTWCNSLHFSADMTYPIYATWNRPLILIIVLSLLRYRSSCCQPSPVGLSSVSLSLLLVSSHLSSSRSWRAATAISWLPSLSIFNLQVICESSQIPCDCRCCCCSFNELIKSLCWI